MYGQGNYPSQFRPPPFPQSQQNQPPPPPPPFRHPPLGPPPPPIHQNPPHFQYQHNAPPPQPYLPPPPPMQGNPPMPPPYSHHVSQPMPPPLRAFPPPPPPRVQGQVLYSIPPPRPTGFQHVPVPPPPVPSSFVSITPAPVPPSLPPPPPPPSSPPPLPPPPPPPISPTTELSDIPKAPSPGPTTYGITNAPIAPNADEGELENKGVVLGDLASHPPKPTDEEVVRNIEVLCQYMVNVGPDFENLARTKEVGNPKFAFLFGGESGSDAAIGHEYFQWVKRKCSSKEDIFKDQEQSDPSSRALRVEGSPQSVNFDNEGSAVSPVVSDMDMEDDVTKPNTDNVVDDMSKEPVGQVVSLGSEPHAVNRTFPSPRSTEELLVPGAAASSNLSSKESVPLVRDGEDSKDSSFLEDVSPVRAVPDSAEWVAEKILPSEDPTELNVLSTTTGGGTIETTGMYVKDESPFRLIQGYASDVSEEDDRKENAEEINSEAHDNISADELRSKPQTDSSQHSPLLIDPSSKEVDLQDDGKRKEKIIKCDPSLDSGLLDANQDYSKLDVDEFGRFVRKGANDSDSDDLHFSERNVKRGGNNSPQDRRRRRSRSPRRGEKRGRSQSRSLSPRARRDRDQPLVCFDFDRGRCFRGASCRFLHRDSSRHMSRQKQHQDIPRDSFELETTAVTEMDIEERNNTPVEDSKIIKMTDASASVKNDEPISPQEVINDVEKSQVKEVLVSSKPNVIEIPTLKSSQYLQDESPLPQSASIATGQPHTAQPPPIHPHTCHNAPLNQTYASQSPVHSHPNFVSSNLNQPLPPGPPPLPQLTSNNLSGPFASQHPTGYHPSQPPPQYNFPYHRPPIASQYHSHSLPPPNPGWFNIPPPPPSSHVMPPRHDFNPQVFLSVEPSHQPPFPMGELGRRPFVHEEAHMPLPSRGITSSSAFVQGSTTVPFAREEYSSGVKDLTYSRNPPPYNDYPSNSSTVGLVDPSLQRYPSSFLDSRATHYNPFASTFEQVPSSKEFFTEMIPLRVLETPPVSKRADTLSDAPKPATGDAYDPLFDSIEPSVSKKIDNEKNIKQKDKLDVDESGEEAAEAEVGAVENASPQLVDEKEWSPEIPLDMENAAAVEIEKNKKSKDSRSMKLFKIAIADFVKEVLKPSWRQGNMSKEAFKTIVKKTVDKVSGAMPSHHVPKSQAKINQYVESSQRKLTKLVMGYVDKYVKM